jgi:hypothetical protein
MEVRYLILARYAEFVSDGTLNVIGGDSDKLFADDYPYLHPVLLAAARVVLNRDDSLHEHILKSSIVADKTDELIAEGATASIPPLAMPAEANFLGTALILPFRNVIFPRPDVYVVHLNVDDILMAHARFRVAPVAYYQGLGTPQLGPKGDRADGSAQRESDQ